MVETPSSSDPGPDQGASQALPEAQAMPETQPSPTAQPSELTAAPSNVADTADIPDTADTLLEANQEVVAEIVSGGSVLIEEVSATVIAAASSAASTEPADVPSIAATLEVPPLERVSAQGEGGEWELLVEKVNAWFASGELQSRWQKIRGPLKGVAILIAMLLALRVYATVVGSIDGIPLVSGLLELTGLIALMRFALTKLVRRSEREQVFAVWKRRWEDFRGDR
jgi:hypothetical protein